MLDRVFLICFVFFKVSLTEKKRHKDDEALCKSGVIASSGAGMMTSEAEAPELDHI